MDNDTDAVFFGGSVYLCQLYLAQTPHGDFAAFRHRLVRLFAGQTVNGGLSIGDVGAGQAPPNAEAGGNHAIQPQGGQGVLDFLYLRVRHLNLRQGNLLQMQVGAPGIGEALQQEGGNGLGNKEVAIALPHADVADVLPADARAN